MVEAILERSKDILEVNFFDRCVAFERFIDHVKGEERGSRVFATEALDQLRVDKARLIASQHREEDFSADLFEIGLVGLKLL